MKKLTFITTALLYFFITACSDDAGTISSTAILEALDIESEATLESSFEDSDVITEAAMVEVSANGRVKRDDVLMCAEVAVDTTNKVITVDYGDGCEGQGGRIRAGKVIIEYSNRRLVPGAYRIVTFEDFSIDTVKVEGTRTLTNISESEEDAPAFSVKLTGGSLTFTDGTTATSEVDHVRTWYRAANPLEDMTTLTGTASGTQRDQSDYSVTILEELVYKRSCRSSRVFIPVSGVKEVTKDGETAIIDYGDGECDNEVEITIDGETFIKIIGENR